MDLSVVILNWNTRELLRDCLASIYRYTAGINFEVIVVDNSSTDGSQAMVVSAFPRVKLIQNTDNLGFAVGNNQGIHVAAGRYILLLNSDTIVLGNLAEAVSFLDRHPQVGMLGVRVLNKIGTIQETCTRRFPSILSKLVNYFRISARLIGRLVPHLEQDQQFDYDRAQPVEVVSGAFMMLPRGTIEQVGGLDESFFLYAEDIDWAKRIHAAGYEIWYAPVVTITHYGGETSSQIPDRTHYLRLHSLAKYFDKHYGRPYGNLYRTVLYITVLLTYLPVLVTWWLSYGKRRSRLGELVRLFHKVLFNPALR